MDTLNVQERVATDAESLINDETRLPDWQQAIPGKTYPGNAVNPSSGASVDLQPFTGTLTAGIDTTLFFQRRAVHLLIQNQSGVSIFIDFDRPANQGAILVPAGGLFTADVPCDELHIWCTSALTYNGITAGNLVIRGWA